MCRPAKRCIAACLILAGELCSSQTVRGGEKLIKINHAESLSFDREKHDAKILKGNVICEHEGTLLYCDTALIFEEQNRMVAHGHVLITKGDSIRVSGDRLVYEGKTRMATLENN